MSEEAQTIQEDQSLVNFAAPREEAPQEAPMAIHEPEPETKADNERIDRPDYYPEKFWNEDGPDVEKLAKSYAELEKAFKSGKHKAPEGDYNVDNLVEQGLDLEDPTVQAYQDWAKKYGVSQQAFEELAGNILAMTGEQEQALEYNRQEEMKKLGDRAQEKISYLERHIMKAGLGDNERQALAMGLDNADAINAMVKFIQGYTNENIPTQQVVDTGDMTREDLSTAIRDPRWNTDPAWRTKMETQWAKSRHAQ
jgi:hypothetical protein